MKSLGRTKGKKTKNGNGENFPHLEIPEAVLDNCIIAIKDHQDSIHLFLINVFVNY